jgi:hypothetical protein
MKNQNGAMQRSGLKGSFPSGTGGSLNKGLASRESMSSDPSGEGMVTSGPNQMPVSHPKQKAGKFTIC